MSAEKRECKYGAKCPNTDCKFLHVQHFKEKKPGSAPAKTVKPKLHMAHVVLMGRSLVKRKAALDAMVAGTVKAPVVPGYFMVPDVKSAAAPETLVSLKEAYDNELRFARDAINNMMGNKPFKTVLPLIASTQFLTTITTGVCSTALALDASAAPEFASFALLFDEYRFLGGDFRYMVETPTPTVVLGTSAIGGFSCFAIGYDPADATAATGTTEIVQLQQHAQLAPRMIATAVAGTYVGVYGRQDNSLNQFKWRTTSYGAFTGNGGAVGPGAWKSTQGNVNTFPDGTLKVYYISGETTAKNCVIGTLYFHLEFRSRT